MYLILTEKSSFHFKAAQPFCKFYLVFPFQSSICISYSCIGKSCTLTCCLKKNPNKQKNGKSTNQLNKQKAALPAHQISGQCDCFLFDLDNPAFIQNIQVYLREINHSSIMPNTACGFKERKNYWFPIVT